MNHISERKTIERTSRRKFVLDATRQLISSNNIENISMDDIASKAEYTRRTLYTYFKSRDEILMMVFTEDLITRWAVQKIAISEVATGLEKIIEWGRSLYRYTKENPWSIHLQFYWDFKGVNGDNVSEETFSDFEKINTELADNLREIFHLGITDGSLRPDLKIDMSISQFLASIRAILNRAFSSSYSFARFDPNEYVEHYLELFSIGIRNTGAQTS